MYIEQIIKEIQKEKYIFKTQIGIFKINNNINTVLSTRKEFALAPYGFTYFNKNFFTGKIEYIIKIHYKNYIRIPLIEDANILAFEVWEVERKTPEYILSEINKPEIIVTPLQQL